LTKIQHLSKVNQKAIMSRLKKIVRNVNVDDIASVEKYLYGLNVSNNYRNKLFLAYQCYCNANNIPYTKRLFQKLHLTIN
jgi:hypothetical protein